MSDLESGEESPYVASSLPQLHVRIFQSLNLRQWPWKHRSNLSNSDGEVASDVELDHIIPDDGNHVRDGYPAYSLLLGRHSEFQTFRRFRTLRMRILLIKQDEISILEDELSKLDEYEQSEMFLGSSRQDANQARRSVLKKLDEGFKTYDDFLQRSQWALNAPGPALRDLHSQLNWLWAKGSIARKEIAYINAGDRELLNIGLVKDRGMAKVAHVVEILVENLYRLGYKFSQFFSHRSISGTDSLSISNAFIRSAARALAASLAIILLLVPVIVLNAVTRTIFRFIILFVSATIFVLAVTIASQATLGEIFATGATYTAVLVVFCVGKWGFRSAYAECQSKCFANKPIEDLVHF